jgi:glycosyltransferase involved in cell wall biosynthesis
LIGAYLKQRCAIEWLADLRDPWTDIYYYNDLMHTSIARKIDAKYELKVLQQADRVLVVSPAIQRLFASKLPESQRAKISVLPNGYDEQDFEAFPRLSSPVNQFVITYTGNLAANYPGDVFLNVLKQLITRNPLVKIIFRFVGVFPNQLNPLIQELKLESSIEHIEYVEHSHVFKYLNSSDLLLLAIPEAKNNEGILTGKLFEYLATNKPIVCIGPPQGDAAEILRACSIGKTFDRGQEQEMLNYLQELLEAHQQSTDYFSKTDVSKNYTRKNLTKELVALLFASK